MSGIYRVCRSLSLATIQLYFDPSNSNIDSFSKELTRKTIQKFDTEICFRSVFSRVSGQDFCSNTTIRVADPGLGLWSDPDSDPYFVI